MKQYPTELLVHPKERVLFTIGTAFSGLVWFGIVALTFGVGLMIAIPVVLISLCVKYIHIASVKGFGIRISESQYPGLYKQAKAISEKLGLEKVPEIYVYHMNGIMNAFAMKIFSRNFIVITTQTLHACNDDADLVGFIIAHEMGHHYRKHMLYSTFLLPIYFLPWFGNAYSRACEYTCDAFGAQFGSPSLEKARQAISILATADHKHSASLHVTEYIDQARDISQFWTSVVNTNSGHPFTTLRYARIEHMFGEGHTHMPRSNPFGVFLAPLFSKVMLIILFYLFILISIGASSLEDQSTVTPAESSSETSPLIDVNEFDYAN